MRWNKVIVALIGLMGTVRASEPPAYLPPLEPPVAQVVGEVDVATDAKAACVSVFTGPPGTIGHRFGGSAVVIARMGEKSLVVTNNHIFSEQPHPAGGFRDDIYPQPAAVRAGGTEYRATALAADRTADIAVVLVEGPLTPAPIANEVPAVGSKVWRNGIGSGYQTGTVSIPWSGLERFSLTVNGHSESGDSGAGYFNEKNELVGIHCGQDGTGRPRGTAVRFVMSVVRERAPLRLFPRLRTLLENRRSASATVVVTPQMEPPAAAVPPKAPDAPPVAPPSPGPTYRQVTYTGRFGRTFTQWELVPGSSGSYGSGSGCPGGRCPLR